jgi:RNA polymerase sigma-70 factor (ECF subfamily)
MQEGFVKIFNALENFKGESNIKTWMRSIMVNTAINFYRHKQLLDFRNIDTEASVELNSVDETTLDKISTDELLKIVNELPNGYRLVFNMYAIEGYKHKEIAELLDISIGASKSQLAKARKYLQVLVEEKLGITQEDVRV